MVFKERVTDVNSSDLLIKKRIPNITWIYIILYIIYFQSTDVNNLQRDIEDGDVEALVGDLQGEGVHHDKSEAFHEIREHRRDNHRNTVPEIRKE